MLQQEAKEELIQLLQQCGKKAKAYKAYLDNKKREQNYLGQNTKLQALHETIFISGGRGAGKTVFMRSAKQIWCAHKQNYRDAPQLYFLPEIDPTLLMAHDHFANVVIAHLYNEVEAYFSQGRGYGTQDLSDERKDFYDALQKLSKALTQPNDLEKLEGMDRIQQYRSGVQLEQYFHQFITTCCNILNADAFVFLIDDVDMATNRAYEVLEVVRKLLSCPQVITLVSGDMELYESMTWHSLCQTVKMDQNPEYWLGQQLQGQEDRRASAKDQHTHDLLQRLTQAYLNKVLPCSFHIALKTIQRLYSRLGIQFDQEPKPLSVQTYFGRFTRRFYPLLNGLDESTQWQQPANAREFVQFVQLFGKLEGDDLSATDIQHGISWAKTKRDGVLYTNMKSMLTLMESSQIQRLTDLMAFHVTHQMAHVYTWKPKPFIDEQHTSLDNKKNEASPAERNILAFLQKKYPQNNGVFRSMPPLEWAQDTHFRIGTKYLSAIPTECYHFALYTHRAFYNKTGNESYQVLFSRAFEVLALSLFNAPLAQETQENKAKSNKRNRKAFGSSCSRLFCTGAFHSIFAFNPNQEFDDGVHDQQDDSEEEGNTANSSEQGASTSVVEQEYIPALAQQLVQWEQKSL